ncbi:right-handed parallel beta-helix repeat-containing protein [Candidatus Poribacteria bacterium]|nr:right-handed parallel beta-helix repeat-containing protein [Candidatus Poribacteria bacterium]
MKRQPHRIVLYFMFCAVLFALIGCGETDNQSPADELVEVPEDEDDAIGQNPEPPPLAEPVSVIELSGALETMTLEATNIYKLISGPVVVPAGTVLTIEPGTVIQGSHSPRAWLEVEVGGKIIAEGTPTHPIIFTSDKPEGSQAAGDWGGLVIKGDSIGHFKRGGNLNDSSGILKYVRIEFAGSAYGDGHLNGISFNHVGGGTVVEYIQVFEVLDDAIELFGGNVDLRYVIVSGFRDDGIDWTQGYTGTIQYLICQKTDGHSDRGIEGDNNPDGPNFPPRSNPKIYNATIIGMKNEGILLRNGSAATIKNSIVMDGESTGLMVDATSANNPIAVKSMQFMNNIFFNNHPNLDNTPGLQTNAMKIAHPETTLIVHPQLQDVANWNWKPQLGSPALDAANADGAISDFIGAIGNDDWTIGWIRR